MRHAKVELGEGGMNTPVEDTLTKHVNPARAIVDILNLAGAGSAIQSWRKYQQRPAVAVSYRAVKLSPQDAERASNYRRVARRSALMPAFGLMSDDDQPIDGTTYQKAIRAEWE